VINDNIKEFIDEFDDKYNKINTNDMGYID
jgi:hypothetical protein